MTARIARTWRARATADGAAAYVHFFDDVLVPQLRAIDGHQGALVLLAAADDVTDITVHTFWSSKDAVSRFAGADLDRAVVEPEAQALLLDFDAHVTHAHVALDTTSAPPA